MNAPPLDRDSDAKPDSEPDSVLPGEPGIPDLAVPRRSAVSRKALLAIALLILVIIGIAGLVAHLLTKGRDAADAETRQARDRPAAATTEPRKLEVALPSASASVPAAKRNAPEPHVPAIKVEADEVAEPIGVRRTGKTAPSSGKKTISPEDAPVLLVSSRPSSRAAAAPAQAVESTPPADEGPASATPDAAGDPLAATSRNLQAYQRQLQGLLDSLTRTASLATGTAPAAPTSAGLHGLEPALAPANAIVQPPPALFGGHLQRSATPRASATTLGDRSLTLPKGTSFTCALKTRVISATSGFIGCQVQRNVYGDNGRVLLIERGSHLDGEYRIASVRPGMVRIPVLWTRIRTPLGVTVDIDSPGTGPLGESGIDGYVDNRWPERIGAAMLLSLIDDSVQMTLQHEANNSNASTVVLPSTTANGSKLAEKVLDSSINIPPLIYQNQGGIVGIYVARDVDFSPVYELKPSDKGLGGSR